MNKRIANPRDRKTKKLLAIILPELKKGEHYAGIALKDGKPSHHLVLLPGEAVDVTWDKAVAWAKKQGGELPSRQEQSLLFTNVKEHFQPRYYWSAEEYASGSACAWSQGFDDGYQDGWHKGDENRARAVRRVAI